MIFLVQYKTQRCNQWTWANTRGDLKLAMDKANDWAGVPCVTETRVTGVSLTTGLTEVTVITKIPQETPV